MLSQIRAIAFDLDDTLWEVGPVIARAEERLLEWLRAHCPRIPERFSTEQMRAARVQLAQDEPHRAHDFTYLRTASLARHALECGYEEEVAERAFEVFFAARNEVELFADVRPALERLSRRFGLATLSNGNADLSRIGLAEVFACSLNARGVGAAKPDARGFLCVAEALELRPAQIIYAGDDPWLDIIAARAAGLRSAWINRRADTWPANLPPPDLQARDCLHLAEQLGA